MGWELLQFVELLYVQRYDQFLWTNAQVHQGEAWNLKNWKAETYNHYGNCNDRKGEACKIQQSKEEKESYIPRFPVPSNPIKIKFTGTGRYIESISIRFR